MREIMKRAWEIAREGQEQFGGKVSEYLSESMKMAWAEQSQKEEVYEVAMSINNDNLWIAEIVGTHPTYRLDRKFLNDYYISDNGYYKVFDLTDGVYAGKFSNRGAQQFFQVKNGEAVDLTYNQVIAYAKTINQQVAA